ncbi:amino acid ABC transporter permease [Caldimonas thermodepolymerans]|jgi:amine acid ABC transporter, permease protein, 3-TM region, His/Glu/Gln/Arg/opine family|uniref:amino acid ABC transporter permease n=1 Tax=Caldimonas thermodepolymerans TaxID=215580 RepID=UPI0024928E99|nr:amino acid ABC transporter permease [Caldimonas thermodepolymerans]
MISFTTWDVVRNLLLSLPWTLALSFIAFLGGGLVGLLLLVLRLARPRIFERPVAAYVQVFQGTPLLMQLFLVYFGLALAGVETSPMAAAVLCFTFYASAYLTENWRGCVESIPKGQWEASACLALTFTQQLRYVIFPQALRLSVPPTVGLVVQIIKNTSLASVVGFVELTRTGQMIANVTFQPFVVYGLVALFYFALCFPCSMLGSWLEKRMRLQH